VGNRRIKENHPGKRNREEQLINGREKTSGGGAEREEEEIES